MYGLTKKKKLEFIIEKVKELDLTSYDIGKKTNLSISGVEKILNGTVKNPQEKTLNLIIEYLIQKVTGSNLSTENNKNEEPQETYSSLITEEAKNNPLVICLNEKNKLTLEVLKLQNLLRSNNISFKDFFEEENK